METSLCPAPTAHPGLLGQPSTLRTMGLGQTGAEQERGMNEGGRGRLATGQHGLPSPWPLLSSTLCSDLASWPQPGGRPREDLTRGLALP